MGFNGWYNNTLFLFKSMKRNFQCLRCDWLPLCSFKNNVFIFVDYFNILALVWQVLQRSCGSWNCLSTEWKCQQVLMAKLLIFSLSLTIGTVAVTESTYISLHFLLIPWLLNLVEFVHQSCRTISAYLLQTVYAILSQSCWWRRVSYFWMHWCCILQEWAALEEKAGRSLWSG